MNNAGHFIREMLKARGVKQGDLARMMSTSSAYISRILTQDLPLSQNQLQRLLTVVKIDSMIGEEAAARASTIWWEQDHNVREMTRELNRVPLTDSHVDQLCSIFDELEE